MTVYNLSEWTAVTTELGLVPLGVESVAPVQKVVHYQMRRSDTGVMGGYAFWVNITGDTQGAPAAVGTVGPAVCTYNWLG